MAGKTRVPNFGVIVAVRGSVVDVRFDSRRPLRRQVWIQPGSNQDQDGRRDQKNRVVVP
jgi:hypothetical protein